MFRCILFRLHMLRLSKDQVESMLSHDNPFIKCLALIYLRLMLPPAQIWDWFEDMLGVTDELVLTAPPNIRHVKVHSRASSGSAIGLWGMVKYKIFGYSLAHCGFIISLRVACMIA